MAKRPLHILVLKLLLATAAFWIPVVIFLILANEVLEHTPLFGDVAILNWLHSLASPGLDQLAVAVTVSGGAAVVVVGVLLAAIALYRTHRRRQAVFLLICTAGTAAINQILKFSFQRDRPDLWEQIILEHGYSFPSGHAMMSSTLAFCVIVLCWHSRFRWQAVVAGSLYFVLVSLSRVYLGVHYPSDILAGWCVSLLWIAVAYKIYTRYGKKPTEPAVK